MEAKVSGDIFNKEITMKFLAVFLALILLCGPLVAQTPDFRIKPDAIRQANRFQERAHFQTPRNKWDRIVICVSGGGLVGMGVRLLTTSRTSYDTTVRLYGYGTSTMHVNETDHARRWGGAALMAAGSAMVFYAVRRHGMGRR
jgi:hypothetical protein